MYVKTSDLPDSLRSHLGSQRDVEILARTSVSLQQCPDDGDLAYSTLVNLATGEHATNWGSWGGANIFNPHNVTDLDSREHEIPAGGAVIQGTVKHRARIYLHPSNVLLALTAGDVLGVDERAVMYAIGCLKSGPYRHEALAKVPGSAAIVDRLVDRGLLARNKAGAVSVTLAGKNTRGRSLSRW